MSKFRHWVIIRYNIGLYDQRYEISEQWMKDRFELFNKYTLRSLINQTVKDFTLAILIDRKTPSEEIKKFVFPDDMDVRFYYIDYPDKNMLYKESTLQNICFDSIKRDVFETNYSIQTRIDNDDAFYPSALAEIRNILTSREKAAIDISQGIVLDTENKKAYDASHYFGSPFISIFQDNRRNATFIYECQHKQIGKRIKQISIDKKLWIMIIHENNISNRVFDWMIKEEVPYKNTLIEAKLYG